MNHWLAQRAQDRSQPKNYLKDKSVWPSITTKWLAFIQRGTQYTIKDLKVSLWPDTESLGRERNSEPQGHKPFHTSKRQGTHMNLFSEYNSGKC
ncbi:hypothetical protein I79_018274 [Cricetulus griseus]|uniref:Uncharacterized protein n=1 Tax=Cricetulus griseus TaxID=10029 RepID=G3I497_CRIGR|nr:hypothetical protein I79_018274 [Cricetulus griseus]